MDARHVFALFDAEILFRWRLILVIVIIICIFPLGCDLYGVGVVILAHERRALRAQFAEFFFFIGWIISTQD